MTTSRIIKKTRKFDHITPVIIQLHWLPIPLRIEFKICLLTYKALNGLTPSYLKDLLILYTPERLLRSSNQNLLKIVKVRGVSFGQRAFSSIAPKLWNPLPVDMKNSVSLGCLKKCLKTYLFKKFVQNPHCYM